MGLAVVTTTLAKGFMAVTLAGLAATGSAGCAGRPKGLSVPRLEATRLPRVDTAALEGPPGLPAVVVAELGAAEREVLVARHGEWALLATRSGGKWLVGPVRRGPQGKGIEANPDGMHEVATGALATSEVAVEAGPSVLRAHADGYLLVWAESFGVAPAIEARVMAFALDLDGKPKGEPREVARGAERIDWVDVLSAAPGDASAYIVWDRDSGGRVELEASRWTAGKASAPARIFTGRAWHAVATDAGLFVAGAELGPAETTTISVSRARWTAERFELVHTQVVTDRTAIADAQVAPLGSGVVVAWTDQRDDDAHVYTASLSGDLAIERAPEPAVEPVGAHALVSLVGTSDGERALLAFERHEQAAGQARVFELAVLAKDGRATRARAELSTVRASETPHFVADGAGFGVLALAPMRLTGADSDYGALAAAPCYLRLDAKLVTRAAEPIRVAELDAAGAFDGVPELVHALECRDGLCTLVAHGHGSPSLLALVELPLRASPWVSPLAMKFATEPAHASSLATIVEVDGKLADLDAVRLADGRLLVVWVTEPHAGDAKSEYGRLELRFIEADGRPGEVVTLSEKALAHGGVDVEALAIEQGGTARAKAAAVAVIGWSAASGGPQVFATKIDARGQKVRQKAITKFPRGAARGGGALEIFDVELAALAGGGILAAWADTRRGESQIHVARLDGGLEVKGREELVSDPTAASSEPELLVLGERVLLAWSALLPATARVPERVATIMVTTLERSSERPIAAPREIFRSSGHARTPRLIASDGKAALTWIDEARTQRIDEARTQRGDGSEGRLVHAEAAAGLYLVPLDERGQPLAQARSVRTAGGRFVTSATASCHAGTCRGVVASVAASELLLGAFATPFEGGAPVAARAMTMLPAGVPGDLRLVAAPTAEHVVFVEERNGKSRIRLLDLAFQPARAAAEDAY
ncbi:MAG: hypothetical protein EXR75_10800 [Myxococcales bacterium]|nr:hypothetical protein [Myxococcales bacterium]